MESLATVMRDFGVHISVLEPGPVRTAFFANVGGHVDNISNDDPYAELINRFNRRMAALGSGGQSAESVADVIREIAAERSPALRLPVVGGIAGNRCTEAGRPHWQEHIGRNRRLVHPE
jgi:short-subunit dehydrogenase